MTPRFDQFVAGFVFPHECEYERGHYGDLAHVRAEHDPDDPGGTTKWGIDQRSHPELDIERLTMEQAKAIYWQTYWHFGIVGDDGRKAKAPCDDLPEGVGEVFCDIRINGGEAGRLLQLALIDCGETLTADNVVGPATFRAAARVGARALVPFLRRRQQRYNRIAKGRLAKFLGGWTNRNNDLAKFVGVLL